jgi:hypothetical protein
MADETLYVVMLEPDADVSQRAEQDMVRLGEGAYLCTTTRNRSRLYHALKRQYQPTRLLVAPLADAPKFKGMEGGCCRGCANTAMRPRHVLAVEEAAGIVVAG